MPQRDTQIAKYLNELTEGVLYAISKQVALDLFEWDGLPEGLTTDILEEYLFSHGKVIWFEHENGLLMALPGGANGERNIYNQPTVYDVHGVNYRRQVSVDNAVRMKNNPIMLPTDMVVRYFVIKLYEVERTLDNHVKAHKVSKVVTANNNTLLSVKNMLKKIDENELNIIAGKSFNIDDIDVLDLEIEFIGDKLADLRNDIQNQFNTFLGINNANTDKKERLITDEVNANDDAIARNLAYMFRSRREAVDSINEMFGTQITVKIAHQSTDDVDDGDTLEDDEGDDDGSI